MNHLFILLLIVSLFFTSCNKDGAGQSVPVGGNLPTNYIIISDGAFSPNSITVVNGSSITFVNRSGVAKGIYSLVEDEKTLSEIRRIGKLLFYDPILSGNNMRSCASCHKPLEYFTDTVARTALNFGVKLFPGRR